MSNVTPLENEVDRELRCFAELWKLLEPLKPDARMRALGWLTAKACGRPRIGHLMPPLGDDLVGVEP